MSCCICYASTYDRQRHYVFDLCISLCVLECMHGGGVLWLACHWLLVGTKISFCALAPLVGDRMIFCTTNCQSFGSRSDGDRHPRENCQIQVQPGTHAHARLMALFPGLPRWAGTRKVKPIWILLKQETVSGTGISWAVCKSAPRSRQITMSAPHHSVFYRLVALPATQPTASKHWRQKVQPGNWCQMRDNWRYWILMLQSHWKGVTLSH